MNLGLAFFFNSILLGTGLAMDAFSVSLANGLNEPEMKKRKIIGVAGCFAFFQSAMPLIGWICVSAAAERFRVFEKFIPVIALGLLGFIGIDMLRDGIKHKDSDEAMPPVGFKGLIAQSVATSVDALSVGFTVSQYSFTEALLACMLIGSVTFLICFAGILAGRKAGTKLLGKAGILGGSILLFIGIKIFLSSLV